MADNREHILGHGIAPSEGALESGHTHLELSTDAGWLLLLVQMQQRLGGSVMQCHTDYESQGLGVQQVLGQTHRVGPALHSPQGALASGVTWPGYRPLPAIPQDRGLLQEWHELKAIRLHMPARLP